MIKYLFSEIIWRRPSNFSRASRTYQAMPHGVAYEQKCSAGIPSGKKESWNGLALSCLGFGKKRKKLCNRTLAATKFFFSFTSNFPHCLPQLQSFAKVSDHPIMNGFSYKKLFWRRKLM